MHSRVPEKQAISKKPTNNKPFQLSARHACRHATASCSRKPGTKRERPILRKPRHRHPRALRAKSSAHTFSHAPTAATLQPTHTVQRTGGASRSRGKTSVLALEHGADDTPEHCEDVQGKSERGAERDANAKTTWRAPPSGAPKGCPIQHHSYAGVLGRIRSCDGSAG